MKKLFVMSLALLLGLAEAKAGRYDGVAPCDGPDVVVALATSTNGMWISTNATFGAVGGLFCGAILSTSAAATDYLFCISSAPLAPGTAVASGTVSGNNVPSIVNNDSRLLFPFLTSSNTAVATSKLGIPPVGFKNLACGVSNAATPGTVYYIPAGK